MSDKIIGYAAYYVVQDDGSVLKRVYPIYPREANQVFSWKQLKYIDIPAENRVFDEEMRIVRCLYHGISEKDYDFTTEVCGEVAISWVITPNPRDGRAITVTDKIGNQVHYGFDVGELGTITNPFLPQDLEKDAEDYRIPKTGVWVQYDMEFCSLDSHILVRFDGEKYESYAEQTYGNDNVIGGPGKGMGPKEAIPVGQLNLPKGSTSPVGMWIKFTKHEKDKPVVFDGNRYRSGIKWRELHGDDDECVAYGPGLGFNPDECIPYSDIPIDEEGHKIPVPHRWVLNHDDQPVYFMDGRYYCPKNKDHVAARGTCYKGIEGHPHGPGYGRNPHEPMLESELPTNEMGVSQYIKDRWYVRGDTLMYYGTEYEGWRYQLYRIKKTDNGYKRGNSVWYYGIGSNLTPIPFEKLPRGWVEDEPLDGLCVYREDGVVVECERKTIGYWYYLIKDGKRIFERMQISGITSFVTTHGPGKGRVPSDPVPINLLPRDKVNGRIIPVSGMWTLCLHDGITPVCYRYNGWADTSFYQDESDEALEGPDGWSHRAVLKDGGKMYMNYYTHHPDYRRKGVGHNACRKLLMTISKNREVKVNGNVMTPVDARKADIGGYRSEPWYY